MSVVTNVVIHYDTLEPNELPHAIASWFEERHSGISSITDGGARAFWGGEKNPECDLLAGAFNYLELDEMLAYLAALPWEYPQSAQVWVKEQSDARFQLWLHDGTRFNRIIDGLADLPEEP
ncbi:hypothetical protein [uncultured Arthrobacter sp.]|uniref:hypothetical protein n=1 Tax=uncultured Arthrobacter sp. TaxID=114050 RepID=UPI003216798D